MVRTYRMRRRALVGARIREFGEPVPEAHLWRTVESSLHSRRIDEASMSEAEFAAAVARYCPEQREQIFARLGLGEVGFERGHSSAPVVVTAPASVDAPAPVVDAPLVKRKRGRPRKNPVA